MTPSKASVQAITAKVKTLCRHAAGAPRPNASIRCSLSSEAGPTIIVTASVVRRLRISTVRLATTYRWAKLRHPHKTGRWITARSVPHQPGNPGAIPIRRPANNSSVYKQRSNPSVISRSRATRIHAILSGRSFQDRDRHLALHRSSAFRATLLRQQTGRCPILSTAHRWRGTPRTASPGWYPPESST